jgi:hypothetical protein
MAVTGLCTQWVSGPARAPGSPGGLARKTKRLPVREGVFRIKPLAVTYSCMEVHTTIGAAAFHFRVRDGIGWDHSAIAARERVEAALASAGFKL